MGRNIQTTARGGVLIVQPTGRFDLTLGYELWQICEPDQRQYRGYVFDLVGVSDLRDSGVAWLLMMERWVANIGIKFKVVNVRPEFARRIAEAGIGTTINGKGRAGDPGERAKVATN